MLLQDQNDADPTDEPNDEDVVNILEEDDDDEDDDDDAIELDDDEEDEDEDEEPTKE